MILDYLSGPGVITSVLINERGKRDRQRRTRDDGSGSWNDTRVGLEDGGMQAGLEAGKARKQILPQSLQKPALLTSPFQS